MKIPVSVKPRMKFQRLTSFSMAVLLLLLLIGCEQNQEQTQTIAATTPEKVTTDVNSVAALSFAPMTFDYDKAISFESDEFLEGLLASKIFADESRLDNDEFEALIYTDIDQVGEFKLVRAYQLTGQTNLYLVHFKPTGQYNNKVLVYSSYDVDDGNISTSSVLSGDKLKITNTHHQDSTKEIVSIERYQLSSNGFELISNQGAKQ